MLGIYKRPKTSGNFTQINNAPVHNLTDVCAIGLLCHLLSRPSEWVIRKTYLYHHFGRGPVTKAISQLEEQKYWVDIEVLNGGRKNHIYSISDHPYSDEEIVEMLKEVKERGMVIKQISEPFRHLLPTVQEKNVLDSLDTDIQPEIDRPTNQQEQVNIIKERRNAKDKKQMLNSKQFKKAMTAACNKLFPIYAPGRWSKRAWHIMTTAFINETIEAGRHLKVPERKISAYVKASIRNMVHTYDLRNGRKVGLKVTNTNKELPELLGGRWLYT